MSRLARAPVAFSVPWRQFALTAALAMAALTAPAPAQIYVDEQPADVVIQAQPVRRAYGQVYSAANHARIVTKQSVMDNGGVIPVAQSAAYVQPGYSSRSTITLRQSPRADFRLDPYAHTRLLNYSYRQNMYYATYGGGYYRNSYCYSYYPGFYYGWWPSIGRYSFPYHRSGYRCGPSNFGGSYFRYSSSCGLSFRLRF